MTVDTPLICPWTKTTINHKEVYERNIAGIEIAWDYAHFEANGAFDSCLVSSIKLDDSDGRVKDRIAVVDEALKQAWMTVRFQFPIVGLSVLREENSKTSKMQYIVPDTVEDVKAWTDASIIKKAIDDSEGDAGGDVLDDVLGLEKYDLKCAYRIYHYTSSVDPSRHYIVLANGHIVSDGCSVMFMKTVLTLLGQKINTLIEDPSAKVDFAWGQEVARLHPNFIDVLQDVPQTSDAKDTLNEIFTELAKPSHGLPVVNLDKPSKTRRIKHVFPTEFTGTFLKTIKAHGVPMTETVSAALALGIIRLAPPTETTPKSISMNSFLVSRMAEVKPEKRGLFPALDMFPCSIAVEDYKTADLWSLANAAKQSANNVRKYDSRLQAPFYAKMLQIYDAVRKGPGPKSNTPTISSMGNLDRVLGHSFPAEKPAFSLDEFNGGTRNPAATLGMHVLTFNGKMELDLTYADNRAEEDLMQRYVQEVASILTEAVRS